MAEIKVTDRRMFAPDGTLREEVRRELEEASSATKDEPAPVAEPAPEPEPTPVAPDPDPKLVAPASAAGAGGPALPKAPDTAPPGLLDLAEFLAGWALASMGDVPRPDGQLGRDLDAARWYIDLLGALHSQWSGKLGPQDARVLESYLDQLRLRFVAHRG